MARIKRDANAIEILKYYRSLVWPVIQDQLKPPVYPKSFIVPRKYKGEQKYHWKAICDYPKRESKYLRPTLTILTAEAMGVNYKKAVKTAAAMQMSEEWILIHDDFEDQSIKRRGKGALHTIYSPGEAVNIGDALHVLMWKLIIENGKSLGTKISSKIAEEFNKIFMRTALGQTVEIKWVKENKDDFEDTDWYFIADSKTAYYTIAGPMRLGAILAGATPKQLDAIAEFGISLGRCFQLVDDLLDLTSDFGGRKEWASDIYEGKRTLILGHLMSKAQARDKKKIGEILAKPREQKTEDEVRFILERMTHYGSIIYAQEQAEKLRGKAYEIFERDLKFLKKEPARSRIEKLMHFVLERDH